MIETYFRNENLENGEYRYSTVTVAYMANF